MSLQTYILKIIKELLKMLRKYFFDMWGNVVAPYCDFEYVATASTKEQALEMIYNSKVQALGTLFKECSSSFEKEMGSDFEIKTGADFANYRSVRVKHFAKYSIYNRKLKLIQPYALSPIPDYGDLLELEKFNGLCRSGGFLDSDGFGRYATSTQESSIDASPSDFVQGVYRKDFTHVVWYNK